MVSFDKLCVIESIHTGQSADALYQVLKKTCDDFIVLLILRTSQRHVHREHIFRVETGIDTLQSNHALQHQAGGCQQYERDCDLRRDEPPADAVLRA